MIEVPLTRGLVALIDDQDAALVLPHRWHVQSNHGHSYAARNVPHPMRVGKYTQQQLHRLILGVEFGDPRKVDHVDGDGLNNCRSNLRIATNKTNRWNSAAVSGARSSYKGVNWCQFKGKNGKWRAQISVGGHQ